MRKLGYTAECVEHRRGSFIRVDLFGFADVMAFGSEPVRGYSKNSGVNESPCIILIQAYHATKDNIEKHAHLNANHSVIKKWIEAGGYFEHHLWTYKVKNGRRYWSVERREIK